MGDLALASRGTPVDARRSVASWWYLGANVPLVIAVFVLPDLHLYLWGLMSLGSAAAVVTGAARSRPHHRIAWVFVALGVTTFALGDISYDVLTKFFHERDPFPSIADGFYLATYLLLTAGLVSMVRARRRRDSDVGPLLDSLIVTTGVGVFSWLYLIRPYVQAAGLGLFPKLVSIGYPLGDILLVCVVVRLMASGNTHGTAVRLLAIGVVGVLVADSVYGWIQLHGTWKVGGPTDLGWVAFYLTWGAAALHPTMRELTVEQPQRSRPLSPVTLVILGAAAIAAPVVIVWRDIVGVADDAGILAGASIVVFILVLVRLMGVARLQAVIARREQALRGISESLVAANDRAAVWDAATDAVVALDAGGVIGCVVTEIRDQHEEIVSSTFRGLVGAAVFVAPTSEVADRRMIRLETGLTVAGTPEATIWTQLTLSTRDGARERVLLAHTGPLPLDLRAILDSIAAQLTLALSRVELARVLFEGRTERRFQSMVQFSSDLITLLDAELHIIYESPAVSAVLGRRADQVIGESIAELIDPDDEPTFRAQITKILTGGLRASSTFEYRAVHASGLLRTIDTAVTNLLDEPDICAIVLNGRDVTERRALEVELNRQAFHDTLTGLANRSLFLDRLSHAMDRGDRQVDPIAVLFLDLDEFKTVNDSLGHPAGDHLLVAVAERLLLATRPGDTVARFGGDEFAVLVESGAMPEAAEAVAMRITEALRPTFDVLGNEITMRASIGIALGQRPHETPDDLLRDADLAMYLAKHNGKGRFEMYQSEMHADAVLRLATASGVRSGLEEGEFEAYYQPIVTAHSGRLVGAEALVRWNHPTRGVLGPSEFIQVAESTGLIVPLGRHVLRDATRQAAKWRSSGLVDPDFYVSVNLSAVQLKDPALLSDVALALKDCSLPAGSLVLEINALTDPKGPRSPIR